MRLTTFTLTMMTGLFSISCGSRLSPQIEVPAEYSQSGEYQQAFTAFWWNCAIVKSLDLAARCPATCTGTPPATAGCSAGAAAAESQIAELEKERGPERTKELLSRRVGEDDGYSHIQSHFPYGPRPEKP
jgi:hypothetical protein